jgi:hypothetical protein
MECAAIADFELLYPGAIGSKWLFPKKKPPSTTPIRLHEFEIRLKTVAVA